MYFYRLKINWKIKKNSEPKHASLLLFLLLLFLLAVYSRALPDNLIVSLVHNKFTFRNVKVYYRVHKSPSVIPALSQTKAAHTLTSHFSNIPFSASVPSTPTYMYS
jgi:1,4-dihydroxy-2-naphthoate octaprenyltransferase